MQVFAHEAIHQRDEFNEVATQCEALQPHSRGALLLGIPDDNATQSSALFDQTQYHQRAKIGSLQTTYYSDPCVAEKELDERLEYSI